MATYIYKIRSKKTGEYSMGGTDGQFNKKGKIWKQRNHLSSHINQLSSRGRKSYQDHDAEIELLEIIEIPVEVTSVSVWVSESQQRRAEKEAAQRERAAAFNLERARAEYERLKKQFGEH
jgi:hypothetical protein